MKLLFLNNGVCISGKGKVHWSADTWASVRGRERWRHEMEEVQQPADPGDETEVPRGSYGALFKMLPSATYTENN